MNQRCTVCGHTWRGHLHHVYMHPDLEHKFTPPSPFLADYDNGGDR